MASDHFSTIGRHPGIQSSPHVSSSPDSSQAQNELQNSQSHRNAAVHAVVDDALSFDVALLSLNATGREPHYFGPSSALSFSRIASLTLGLPRRATDRTTPQASARGGDEQIMSSDLNNAILRLPSETIGRTLSRAYFSHIHPQYPFLHQPTFQAWEGRFWTALQTGAPGDAGDAPLFFVPMVSKIVTHFLLLQEITPSYRSTRSDHLRLEPIIEVRLR